MGVMDSCCLLLVRLKLCLARAREIADAKQHRGLITEHLACATRAMHTIKVCLDPCSSYGTKPVTRRKHYHGCRQKPAAVCTAVRLHNLSGP